MEPVYMSYDALRQFEQLPPRSSINSAKIVSYGNYIFLGDHLKGIHIIDNSDSLNPARISFLSIPANLDFSIQDDRLYADNGPDLLILDISNINNVRLIKRQTDVFAPSSFQPPNYTGYFVCTDFSQGWVIDWTPKSRVKNPECEVI